jgi:AraC family transcriptional regulator
MVERFPRSTENDVSAAAHDELGPALNVPDHDHAAAERHLSSASAPLSRNGRLAAAGVTLKGGLPPWQITLLKAHISANLASDSLSRNLRKLIRLSPSHFYRVFRRSFGETPHAFITRMRIERAKYLMAETEALLSEIALDCGFVDQAHFSRSFKKMTGTSPHLWRGQHRIGSCRGSNKSGGVRRIEAQARGSCSGANRPRPIQAEATPGWHAAEATKPV